MPDIAPRLRILSLGAGVQSSVVALMSACGELPMLDCAIMADTQDEGSDTYAHLEWLCSVLPFPVHRPTRGRLSDALLAGDDEARIPAFVERGGFAKRQCTRNFKIRPIRLEMRRVLGVSPKGYVPPGTVEQWIGISKDEAHRMSDSGVRFITNRWPLIEQGMRRSDCERWLWNRFQRRAPKSSCVYCAFQSDERWGDRMANSRPDFAKACAVDAALRSPENVARFRGHLFLHRSLKPLAEIDFAAMAEQRARQPDLFGNECKGVCGV